MSRHKKTSTIECQILSLEMELNLLEQDVDALKQDLYGVSNLCREFRDNLVILKQEGITATLNSFKDTKRHLATYEISLTKITKTLANVEKQLQEKSKLLEELYLQQEKDFASKENGQNVISLNKHRESCDK